MLVSRPKRVYRTWIINSERWVHYRPRSADIVISTYPKCGTTWMQRIVGLFVFQTPEPKPIMEISPWLERRFPEPVEAVISKLEVQDHRRFIKTHLPFDGLPIFDQVKYIHVARDGRDACLSFHNHATGFAPFFFDALDQVGMADEIIARPYPRPARDPADHFHNWLTRGAVPNHQDGEPTMSFFHFERSWWDERHRSNVLLVHYLDLKSDLQGEMRRIADFLEIDVADALLPGLADAADFETMRRDGDQLMGGMSKIFQGGGARFFHQAAVRGWRDKYRDDDLALYEEKANASLPPDCRNWIAHGRLRPPT